MKKPPEPRPKKEATIGIRTTPEIKAAADVAARAERRSISQWIEGLIIEALRKASRRGATKGD